MRLSSRIAVAVVQAGSCSSDSAPSLGTSIYCRCGPKKEKARKKEGRREGRKKEQNTEMARELQLL